MRADIVPAMNVSYSDRFQNPTSVESYESGEYAANSYSSQIWNLERPNLERIIGDFRAKRKGPLRLLDFACGTGRILSVVENLADEAHGVDISDAMVSLARRKCRKAELRVGDILSQPSLLRGPYDVITCFRFILNVESQIRRAALIQLRKVLKPDGILIVSVHGNSESLRHPAVAWKRWRLRHASGEDRSRVMLNEMSRAEAAALFAETGFEIVDQFGFGLIPPTAYRTPVRGMAAAVDRLFAKHQWWTSRAIDLLFICRPAN